MNGMANPFFNAYKRVSCHFVSRQGNGLFSNILAFSALLADWKIGQKQLVNAKLLELDRFVLASGPSQYLEY